MAEVAASPAVAEPAPSIGLWPLAVYFLKLGTIGLGGPVALVGYMHREVVEGRRWVPEDDCRLALTLAQLMPGSLAAQFAIALGYFLRGVRSATIMGLAFALPSFLMVAALAFLPVYLLVIIPLPWFRRHLEIAQQKAFVAGAIAAAAGAIAGAVIVLGRRAIIDLPAVLIAVIAFVLLWRFKLPESVIVALAGAAGLIVWVAI